MKLLVHVVVLFELLVCVLSDCPIYGCTPSASFTSEAKHFNTSTAVPQPVWSKGIPDLTPTGAGCVTNGGRVICPFTGKNGNFLMSWSSNGELAWNVSLEYTILLPLVDISGALIASDGRTLIGYNSDGTPMGKAVHLYPVFGKIFDLNLASPDYVLLLYKCGFIAVYMTNGLPHASIWLNSTVDGKAGTFVPLYNPVINGNRGYILTAFRPFTGVVSGALLVRLYAIEVLPRMIERIAVVWYEDIRIANVKLPYLESSDSMCSIKPLYLKKERVFQDQDDSPVALVLLDNKSVLFVINYLNASTGQGNSYMSMYLDKGNSTAISYQRTNMFSVQSLAYPSTVGLPNALEPTFWINAKPIETSDSVLLEMVLSSGKILQTLNLTTLLGAAEVTISTKLTFVYSGPDIMPGPDRLPLLFGYKDGGSNYVTAMELSGSDKANILWKIPTQDAIGQISTVD